MATTLIRKDAWNLSKVSTWDPNDQTLLWYAKAVGELSTRPATDPTSWRFQGAIHDYQTSFDPFVGLGPVPTQAIQDRFWGQCQHGSWYFLPWHRMYLGFFEQIVRAAVVHLGGPATWTLPYWNYSDKASARSIPPAFRERHLPDGSPNPLFVIRGISIPRKSGINTGTPLSVQAVDTSVCLGETVFEADSTNGDPGFGGPQTLAEHGGADNGALENIPHGPVHVGVGGLNPRGWMSDFRTAALDPIFWLHHANIDRLWSVWNRSDPSHTDPPEDAWKTDIAFEFNDSGGNIVSMTPSEVIDTAASRFSYDYDDAPVAESAAIRSLVVKPRPIPEMVGASTQPLTLTGGIHTTTVAVAAPSGPAAKPSIGFAETAQPAPKTFLNIENVSAEKPGSSYLVYVNLPANADPSSYQDHYAGMISMFGVAEASVASNRRPGTGLHYKFNITGLIEKLKARNAWNEKELKVSFVAESAAEGGMQESAMAPHPPIQVGRVSLYHA